MAITIEQANAVSKPYYGRFTENVYRQCALLALLQRRKRMQPGGTSAQFPINITELGTTRSRDPRSEVVLGGRRTMTSVKTEWAYYDTPHMIDKDEKVENVGQQAVIRLVSRKVEEQRDDQATKIGRDIYVRDLQGRPVHSLSEIVSASAFGGIDEEKFRAKEYNTAHLKMYSGASDGLSFCINRAKFNNKKPTHIFLSSVDHSQVEATWVDKGGRFQIPQSKETVELGLTSFRFMGVDFVADQFIDEAGLEGNLWGLDLDAIDCYESAEGISTGQWIDATLAGFPGALVRVVEWTGQLTATRRRTMFHISGVDSYSFK